MTPEKALHEILMCCRVTTTDPDATGPDADAGPDARQWWCLDKGTVGEPWRGGAPKGQEEGLEGSQSGEARNLNLDAEDMLCQTGKNWQWGRGVGSSGGLPSQMHGGSSVMKTQGRGAI